MANGCEYGHATRALLDRFTDSFETWKSNDFHHFKKYVEKRLDRPNWAVTFILSGLLSIIVGLVVFLISHRVGG